MGKIGKEFAEAFLAAQQAMKNPAKDHTAKIQTKGGGSFSYQYASLDGTMECVKAALHKHGISVAQPPVAIDERIGVATELIYKNGEVWDRGTLLIKASEDPQKIGSALTYLRRYGLTSAVGIVAEDDDDGRNARSEEGKTKAKKKALAKKKPAETKKDEAPAGVKKVEEHLARIADTFRLFEEAYGPERARDELIGATEFPNDEGEMTPGFDSLDSFRAWLETKKPLTKAAKRVNIICHKIEASYKKALEEDA